MFTAFRRDQNHMIFLPAERVYPPVDTTPIDANSAYCRLWLRNMRLSRRFDWFHRYYPVVHAATSFYYGRQVVKIPSLAGPLLLTNLTQNNLDQVIICNHHLTPLFPFKGGDIELEAGLFSMATNDHVKGFVTAVERIAKLIPVPEFSAVLNLIPAVYAAIEDLMDVGGSQLQIGYLERFVSAGSGVVNQLRGGYFAAILDEQGTLDRDKLCVVDGKLMVGPKGMQGEFRDNPHALERCSYMLFELEKRPNLGGEVDMLPTIGMLRTEAREATLLGDSKKAREIFSQLISAIARSNDLLESEQRRLALSVKDELNRLPLQALQATTLRSLAAIMSQEAEPPLDAETEAALAEWRQFYQAIDDMR